MSKHKPISKKPEATWWLLLATGLLAILFAPASEAANFTTPPTNIGGLAEPTQVVTGLFDSDANLDLAFVNLTDNKVRLRQGGGDGSFSAPWADLNVTTGGGDGPYSLAAGDFDHDGNLDLAVANVFSDNVSVFLGKGDGTFYAATVYDVGVNPTSIVAGDFNEDTYDDLAVTNYGQNKVSILLYNNTNKAFDAPVEYNTGIGPWCVRTAKLKTTHLDLLVANYSDGTVSVLLGNGSGVFTLQTPDVTVGAGPTSIAIGKFNAGNVLDIATTNFADDTVSILLGNGSGGFTEASGSPIAVGFEPISAAAGDFNGTTALGGDTKLDLVVANRGDDSISFLRGHGDGTFTLADTTYDLAVGAGPSSIVSADLNGDSLLDLAVANRFADTGSVFLAKNEDDPPVGTISITGGAYVTTTSVNLAITATEESGGLIQMCINDTPDCPDSAPSDWQDLGSPITWTVPTGDGVKTVYVQFKDARGNLSPWYSDSIILDTGTVGKNIIINDDADYTNSINVTLTLGAASSLDTIQLCNTSDCSDTADDKTITRPYSSTLSWTLLAGDGPKTVYVKFHNARYGDSTSFSKDTITLDATAPTGGSILIDNGNSIASSTAVTLSLAATDNYAGTIQMCINNTGLNTQQDPCSNWENFTATKSWTLSGSGGTTKTVYVWFKDARGNTSSRYSDTIDLIDPSVKPTGSIVINNGYLSTDVPDVVLTLSNSSDAVEMCLSESNSSPCTHWIPTRSTMNWTLASATSGIKTVYAWFRNANGTPSIEYSDSIIIDLTKPDIGTIFINKVNGQSAASTNNPNVTLSLFSSDLYTAVTEMCISNTTTCTDWILYATSAPWTIPSGYGDKYVYVRYKDAQGNISDPDSQSGLPANAFILLDDQAPDTGAMTINTGDSTTASPEVSLASISAHDDTTVAKMCISNNAFCDEGSGWVDYAASYAGGVTTLIEGNKLVVGQIYKIAGQHTLIFTTCGATDNSANTPFVATSACTLGSGDSVNKAASLGNGNSLVTGTRYKITARATLNFATCGASDNTVGRFFTANATPCTLGAGDSVIGGDAIKSTWTLPAADGKALATGEKLVSGKSYAIIAQQTLSFTNYGAGFNTADTIFTASQAVALGTGDRVSRVTDLVEGATLVTGNRYKITSATHTLDFATCGAADNNQNTIFTANATPCILGANDTVKGWSLATPGDGLKNVYIFFKDSYGNFNTTPAASDSITLDTTAPVPGTFTINGGDTATGSNSVTLAISATDANMTGLKMCISNTATITPATCAEGNGWIGYETSRTNYVLTAGDGIKTVRIWFKDAVGNITATPTAATITVKTTDPTGSVVINSGAASATSATVTLTLTSSANALGDLMCISNTNTCSGTAPSNWLAFAPIVNNWALSAGEGTKTVYVWYKDSLNNVNTTPYSDTILLDTIAPVGALGINVSTPVTSGNPTLGRYYKITKNAANTPLDFTTCGAANSTIGTIFLAKTACTLASGDEVFPYADNSTTLATGDPIDIGKTYMITGHTNLNFTSCGALDSNVNTIFTATAACTLGASDSVKVIYGPFTKTTAVTLTLSTTETNPATTTKMCVSNTLPTQQAPCTPFAAYAATKTWTLPAGNNLKTVYAVLQDANGNTTTVNDSITLDTTVPTNSVLTATNGPSGDAAAGIGLSWPDTTEANLKEYILVTPTAFPQTAAPVSCATATGTTVLYHGELKAFTHKNVAAGNHYYRLCAVDQAGNMSTGTIATGIALAEVVPPASTSVKINNSTTSASYTKTTAVTLYLSATDTTPAISACVSNTNTCTAFTALSTTSPATNVARAWTLPAGSGIKTVNVWFKDSLGNVSASPVQTSILLDPDLPTTGTLTATGGPSKIDLSWSNFSDSVAKTSGALVIGQTYKINTRKTLNFTTCNAAADSNVGTIFTVTNACTLGVGDSVYTLQTSGNLVKGQSYQITQHASALDFVNDCGAGNSTVGTIFTATSACTLGTGDSVNPVGSGIATYNLYSGTTAPSTCNTTAATIYTGTNTSFSDGSVSDGTTKYYRICATDAAGNLATGVTASDKARAESVAPTATSVSINGGAAYTKTPTVTLTIHATDNTVVDQASMQMCVSNTNAACTAFVAFATTKTWTLPSVSGDQTVYVTFRDKWGNTTTGNDIAHAAIRLDNVIPTNGTVQLTNVTTQNDLTWTPFDDAAPGSGPISYRLVYGTTGTPASCAAGLTLYTGTDTMYSHIDLVAGTTYYYRICAIDGAGNMSTGATASARYIPETDPPVNVSFTINGGSTYTSSLTATLNLAATDVSGVTQMCVSNTATTAATCTPWVVYATSKTWTLASGTTSPKTVRVWYRDTWGNTTPDSEVITDSIIYDSVRPVDGTVTATRGTNQVALNWSGFADALSGVASYKVVSATSAAPSSCNTGTVVYTGPDSVTTFTNLGLTTGITYYYRVCAIDNAGLMSVGATASATP